MSNNNLINRIFGKSRSTTMDNTSNTTQQSITTDNTPTTTNTNETLQKATFGAGCFWGVEAAYRQIKGVISTAVGYSGGTYDRPSYKDVCTGRTGHAEVVEVTYDPSRVSYEDLLKVFWDNHNPTTLNRQGWDIGTQYRSAIFFHTPEQKAAALASKQALDASGKYRKPIVTEVEPASEFYMAEDYHQQYLEKRGLSSCHI
jgi:peptide-methionine (S)-S-oxide reductase